MSPLSRNWVFGTHYQMYMMNPAAPGARGEFLPTSRRAPSFWRAWRSRLVTAMATSRLGLAVGAWMRGIQR